MKRKIVCLTILILFVNVVPACAVSMPDLSEDIGALTMWSEGSAWYRFVHMPEMVTSAIKIYSHTDEFIEYINQLADNSNDIQAIQKLHEVLSTFMWVFLTISGILLLIAVILYFIPRNPTDREDLVYDYAIDIFEKPEYKSDMSLNYWEVYLRHKLGIHTIVTQKRVYGEDDSTYFVADKIIDLKPKHQYQWDNLYLEGLNPGLHGEVHRVEPIPRSMCYRFHTLAIVMGIIASVFLVMGITLALFDYIIVNRIQEAINNKETIKREEALNNQTNNQNNTSIP